MRLLRDRNFSLIWIGQTLSQFGDSLYDIALIWLAYTLTNNAQSIGLVIFARAAPYFLLGLLAGAYSDRWDRRRTMMVADILRAGIVLAIPALYLTHLLAFWHLMIVAFVLTSVRTFFHPSLQAAVPQVVAEQDLGVANAALHATLQTTMIVGPVIGGLLIAIIPTYHLFTIDSVTFVISALSIFLLRLPHIQDTRLNVPQPHILLDITATLRTLKNYRIALWSIVLFGLGLITSDGLLRVALPVFSTQVLHGQSSTYGLIMGVIAAGTVVGAVLIGKVRTANYGLYQFLGWVFWGTFLAFLGVTAIFPLVFTFALIVGGAQAMADVSITTLLQQTLPTRQLGKVFSFWSTWANIGDALSGLLFGWLVGALPLVAVFVVGGSATAVVGFLGLLQVWRDSSRNSPQGQVIEASDPELTGEVPNENQATIANH